VEGGNEEVQQAVHIKVADKGWNREKKNERIGWKANDEGGTGRDTKRPEEVKLHAFSNDRGAMPGGGGAGNGIVSPASGKGGRAETSLGQQITCTSPMKG